MRGDSQQFKLSLLTDDGFDSLDDQATFALAAGSWRTLQRLLTDFRASFGGPEVPGAPGLDPACIRQLGLTIAARQAGRFAVGIKRISLA